jgi:hypothetical protein
MRIYCQSLHCELISPEGSRSMNTSYRIHAKLFLDPTPYLKILMNSSIDASFNLMDDLNPTADQVSSRNSY